MFGTNAHFVKRPYDAEVSLTVHGLLLVDTMQTYGADFDLLMASHKNLSFDIPTGSLRDSRAQSPVSGSNVAHFTSAATRNNQSATSISLDRVLTKEQESLIKLEYSVRPHRRPPTRLLCLWDSPGKNTGVGCHALLEGIFLTQGLNPCLLHCSCIAGRSFTREATK